MSTTSSPCIAAESSAFDDAALDLARERGVVALTAHVRALDKTFAPPRVVTPDELTCADGGVPFLEDRETPQPLARFKERRATWISFYERRAGDAAALWTDIAPALCAVGPVGGGALSRGEYLDVATIARARRRWRSRSCDWNQLEPTRKALLSWAAAHR